jgi:GT2 family glycosyltransferase
VGNWRQFWRDVHFDGEAYGWSKHSEFERFLELPSRTSVDFELALSSYEPEDRALLERHGWSVRDALPFSIDLDDYRDYISDSLGEFTVAKDQNVRLRSGWFSDRSATYLAAGRPVVTQDTGFSNLFPTGEGLFAVTDVDGAAAAVEQILSDHAFARRAATEIAREYFDAERVLGAMLSELGVAHGTSAPRQLLADDLSLIPIARRPLRLAPDTAEAVAAATLPRGAAQTEIPEVSVVVITHNGLPFTRLCLESVLANTDSLPFELIVVDNGSQDGTRCYLRALERRFDCVKLLFNDENLGFPRGSNQGLTAARGSVLVLLNNDTIVPPGTLAALAAHAAAPDVGLVGPVTNRSGNEAEVDVSYATYGEMLALARRRGPDHAGLAFDIDVATLFCAALRRDVFEHVGLLDERYEVGLFEDDDYALRVRAAGYRVVCVEDVFVHHFGEASLGNLAASGRYVELFRENKARFEAKWGLSWRSHLRRPNSWYRELSAQLRQLAEEELPSDATVLVVSKGDEELLLLGAERKGWHFPQMADGTYAGYHPGDSGEAVAHLRALQSCGAEYILFPETAIWWLEFYEELARMLIDELGEVARRPGVGVVFGGARVAATAQRDAVEAN